MTKLTESQSLILNAGAKRPRNIALPLPKGLAGAAAKMVVTRMIDQGWLQEIDADPRRGEPLWRETGDGRGTTLVVTEAGLLAFGIEPVVVSAVVKARNAKAEHLREPPVHIAVREGTKLARIIALLQRAEGATIAELQAATGWQAHTVRGAMSGPLKKKLKLVVISATEDGRGRAYRIGGSRCP